MKQVEIGEVTEVLTGQSAPQDPTAFGDSGIPFIRAGSLKDLLNGKREEEFELINQYFAKKYKLKLFPHNTVIFAKSGMSAKLGRIYRLKTPSYLVSHLAAILPCEDLNPGYLERWLQNNSPSRLIPNDAYPSIKISSIASTKIDIPDLEYQEKVAEILEKADILRQKRKESIKLLDDFLKSIFLEMFGDPLHNPKGWYKRPLKKLTLKIDKLNPVNTPNEKFSYIDISSIDNEKKSIISKKEFIGKNAPSRARQLLEKDDILISTVRPNLNAVALVIDKNKNLIGSTGFCVLRTNNKIDYRYVFEFTKSKYFINTLINKVVGANYPAVSNKQVLDVEIPVPSEKLQNEFADIGQQVEILKAKFKESKMCLDNLFSSIMQQAFRGEL